MPTGRCGRAVVSGSGGWVCLTDMHIFYVAITILAALAYTYAASMNFVGAASVKVIADKVQVSQEWMVPFGTLLASGAVGLLIGFAVPALGVAASIGLVVYFVCALGAHIRVRDRQIAGAVSFLVLAVAALIAGLGYHNHW
jgi:DoxX-like protein